MKSEDIKKVAFKVICLAVKHHGQAVAVQITVMQSLQFYKHLSEPLVDCLIILTKEYDYPQLGDAKSPARPLVAKTRRGPEPLRDSSRNIEICRSLSAICHEATVQDQLDSEVSVTPQRLSYIVISSF